MSFNIGSTLAVKNATLSDFIEECEIRSKGYNVREGHDNGWYPISFNWEAAGPDDYIYFDVKVKPEIQEWIQDNMLKDAGDFYLQVIRPFEYHEPQIFSKDIRLVVGYDQIIGSKLIATFPQSRTKVRNWIKKHAPWADLNPIK